MYITGNVHPIPGAWLIYPTKTSTCDGHHSSRWLFASSKALPKSCAAPWQSDTDSCR